MSHEDLFRGIYRRKRWASHGVLSGDGSRQVNNRALIDWLERQAAEGMRSMTDLGCGDLEWISRCEAVTEGRLAYQGVDVVPSLVAHHRRVFPWFRGEAEDLEAVLRVDSDLVILKDVLPHLCNGTAGQILLHAETCWKWKRLVVTSHPGADNEARKNCRGRGEWRPLDVEASGILSAPVIERLPRCEGVYLVYGR